MISKRWQLPWLVMLSLTIIFGAKCNFGAARTYVTGGEHSDEIVKSNYSTMEFTAIETGMFLTNGVFSLPAGLIIYRVIYTRLFVIAMLIYSVCQLILPSVLFANVYVTVALTMIQGCCKACVFPCIAELWRYWAPTMEKSRLISISQSGLYLGFGIGISLSAFLTDTIGWQWAYYTIGLSGLLWCLLWQWIVYPTPADHPTISQEELEYIEMTANSRSQERIKAPWYFIWTSLPVWSIILAQFANVWALGMFSQLQLVWMNQALGLDLKESSMYSATPYLLKMISLIGFGIFTDWIVNCGVLGRTTTRKLSVFIGFRVNFIEVAPRHAGLLTALGSTWGQLAAAVSILISEWLIRDGPDGWVYVFAITSALHAFTAIFFLVFGTSDSQSWSTREIREDLIAKDEELIPPTDYGTIKRGSIS